MSLSKITRLFDGKIIASTVVAILVVRLIDKHLSGVLARVGL